MKDFMLWFIQEFPSVLLQPPISSFVGLVLVALTIDLFRRMMKL